MSDVLDLDSLRNVLGPPPEPTPEAIHDLAAAVDALARLLFSVHLHRELLVGRFGADYVAAVELDAAYYFELFASQLTHSTETRTS